jgi:multiple sugar transport system permease protein
MDINVKKSLEKIEDLEIGLEIVNKPKLTEIIIKCIRHLILIGVSLITFFPFLWMISSALKTKD